MMAADGSDQYHHQGTRRLVRARIIGSIILGILTLGTCLLCPQWRSMMGLSASFLVTGTYYQMARYAEMALRPGAILLEKINSTEPLVLPPEGPNQLTEVVKQLNERTLSDVLKAKDDTVSDLMAMTADVFGWVLMFTGALCGFLAARGS